MATHRRSRIARYCLSGTAAGFATCAAGAAPAAPPPASGLHLDHHALLPEFTAHYDGVLGTSMDLIVHARSADIAAHCEQSILGEIDRLSAILSTYDSRSEISRVMGGGEITSQELAEVLALYELWNARTGGAIHVNLADVRRLWTDAQRTNASPRRSDLQQAFQNPRAFNVDALGKGFIIDRAVAIAQPLAPAGLLNIGGDIRVWGDQDWTIGVADPLNHADNSPPLTMFSLRNAAVASSGGYARYFTIADARYSHIIDPRTLVPVSDVSRAATAIADDCVTANALSTSLCILEKPAADSLAKTYAAGHLTVHDGAIDRGGSLAAVPLNRPGFDQASNAGLLATPADAGTPSPNAGAVPLGAAAKWMKDYRVEIAIDLKKPDGGRVKRPYVVVWIENEAGRPVRNITLWGTQDKYLPHLSTWWKLINANLKGAKALAAATRPAGKYTLFWDGRSDSGTVQPQGTYKVHVEISRENGTHTEPTATIHCEDKPDSATLGATAESDESKIEYKKPGKN